MKRCWGAADEAYVCPSEILTPWPGQNLTTWQSSFNYWMSSARILIEQVPGILSARWGILWRPLRVSVDKATLTVMAGVKLHNFIINEEGNRSVEPVRDVFHPDQRSHQAPYDLVIADIDSGSNSMIQGRRRDLEDSTLRDRLKSMLET